MKVNLGIEVVFLLAVGFIGKSDTRAVVINDSAVGDGRVFGVTCDVAQDILFRFFDNGIGKNNKAVGSEFKTPIDDGVKFWFEVLGMIA